MRPRAARGIDGDPPDRKETAIPTATAPKEPAVFDSARRPHAFLEELQHAWRYRALVYQLVIRDIKVRYKRSVLGVLWTLANPLLMMIVLTVVFSYLFRLQLKHYSIYVLAGLTVWHYFGQTTNAAMRQLVRGGGLLGQIYVPRTIFALCAAGTGLVNLVISLVPLAVMMAFSGAAFSPALLILPLPTACLVLFSLGMGLLLSTLAMEFPDVVEMYDIVLSAWYFLTPIMYPLDIVPEALRGALRWNPLYPIMEAFRDPIQNACVAPPELLLQAVLVSVAMFLLGWFVFASRADRIAYNV